MSEALKLDVLAVAAHPDDVEISCGGTICLLVEQGYQVGIVDLTRGELGTQGTPEQRAIEAELAREIMGVPVRVNLGLPDGEIVNNRANQVSLMRVIRSYRPEIMLIGAPDDRHPDHGDAARLSTDAIFYAGLARLDTVVDGVPQAPWRPAHTLHYMQSLTFEPDFVVDVSSVWEKRTKAVAAFGSQLDERSNPKGQRTFISDPGFMRFIESRAQALGYRSGATYGEGFLYRHGPLGVQDLVALLGKKPRT